ncbi:hypothetical protein DY000_02031192 [Brassica cretica]|uniref:Uncharacterized protein n=1 Tax=Brassica cretica TaxID=69181 RepID=A0ABQ7DE05_BRACR|nr:hypothetical protein DY000_02031192 [Brassica cretica]
MADHLGLQVEPSKESFTFVDCSQRSSGGVVRHLEVQIVGAVCNLQTNQLCLVLIDPHVHYNPIPVKKPQRSSRSINDPGLIAACHCGAEYETEYSASIETHTATSIDSARQISTDTPKEESVDGSPNDWENDYYNPTMAAHTKDTMHTEEYDEDFEKERAIEYKAALEEENRLLHHSSWKGMRRRSTEHAQHRSTSILFKQDENEHRPTLPTSHRSTLESTVYEKETTRLAVGQMITITKAMQRDEADQLRAEAIGKRTRLSHPIDRANRPSIDNNHPSSIASKTKIHYILQMANGADNLFMQQTHRPSTSAEGYMTQLTSIIRQKRLGPVWNQKILLEEKDEYGVYRDDQGCTRDVDGHIINVSKDDIKKLMERASRDEHIYICLPEHASSFSQTKLVPEIYTKDEINEMFYGVCGAQEKYEGDFQMKLDGVYYPLNDSIRWLTTCMEEMREIVEIQSYIARRPEASASIDRRNKKSTDIHRQKSVNEATNRGLLVPKVTSDMSDTHNQGEEISADTYATLRRHQFNLEI